MVGRGRRPLGGSAAATVSTAHIAGTCITHTAIARGGEFTAHEHHSSGHDDSDSAHSAKEGAGVKARGQVPLTYEQATDAVAAIKTGYGPRQLYSGSATYRALIEAGAEFTLAVDVNGMAVPGPVMQNVVAPGKVGKKKKKKKKGHKKKSKGGVKVGHKKKKKK